MFSSLKCIQIILLKNNQGNTQRIQGNTANPGKHIGKYTGKPEEDTGKPGKDTGKAGKHTFFTCLLAFVPWDLSLQPDYGTVLLPTWVMSKGEGDWGFTKNCIIL